MAVIVYEEDGTASRRHITWLRPVPADTAPPKNLHRESLAQRAERLWPESEPHGLRNRLEWLRAVAVVRATKGGWRAESRVSRLEKPL